MKRFGKRNKGLQQRATSFELQGASTEQQGLFWTIVLGILLVICGGAFLLQPQLGRLECDRLQYFALCKLTLSSLRNQTVTPFPLEQLEQAKLQYFGKSHQLVLQTSDSNLYFPVNRAFNSTQDQVDQVNAFLKDSTTRSLKLEQDNRWFIYPIAVFMLQVGSLLVWSCLSELVHRFRTSV